MADIPASALLGQFAEEITPAGQTVFGLKAQPFADNNGAALGDIPDTDRGNVSITLTTTYGRRRRIGKPEASGWSGE